MSVHRSFVVACALLACGAAPADVVVLDAVRDNTLFSTGDTSNGAGDTLFSGRTGGGTLQRAVLAFAVADGIPAGSTIESATLSLTLIGASPQGQPQELHVLHRLLADWGEGTSSGSGGQGAPATKGDATWFHTFYPDAFWSSPGGDFAAAASAEATVGLTPGTVHVWGSTPEMVADVQGWLDDPATDFGWLLTGDEDVPNSARKLASREHADAALRPTLTVEFTPPCPWDCAFGGNGHVGILDLLVLIHQWGEAGGSCDFDLGEPGVGVEELLALLFHWGACE